MEKKEWLTAKEVAELTGVTVNRVYNWKKEGRVKSEYLLEKKQGFKKRIFFHRRFVAEILEKEV
jgi:predicted site-specific integrase-resolvase